MRRLTAIIAVGVVVLALVVAQLVLPGIAAQQLRDRLSRSGEVLSVQVSAFPAIELLWHNADKVVIRMRSYHSSTGNLGSVLSEASGVGTLDASATELQSGLLTVHNATLKKRGNVLSASAVVSEADLIRSFPILQSVQPVASGNGALVLRGTATLFGVSVTVDATVAAVGGQLVVRPNLPFGSLATVTVFSNPHVAVEGVAASPTPGGFAVTAVGRLR